MAEPTSVFCIDSACLMHLDLSDKTALVTGGTRGIGRAIVNTLSRAGARVAFTFRSSADAAADLVDTVEESGGKALALQGDAAQTDVAEDHVGAVLDAWETLDILVNNAGITRDGLLLRLSEQDWDDVMDANLKGVFNYAKAAYRPFMRQREGRVINISSVVGAMGNPGQTNYAASKAGIIGFSKSLAKELASRNVTVNVVAPGFVETDMTEEMSEKAQAAMQEAVPLGRPASTDDVAQAVCYLASDAASYITGHVLHVDGGLAM
jgi:3-oxoacyl-[acyl-carrier protein] reductase